MQPDMSANDPKQTIEAADNPRGASQTKAPLPNEEPRLSAGA
jgi:hypothetical protein